MNGRGYTPPPRPKITHGRGADGKTLCGRRIGRVYCERLPEHPANCPACAKVAALSAQSPAPADSEDEETYQIGFQDGYERAVQDIDLTTGGDGEYFASTIPGRGCPDAASMKRGIVDRFDAATARLREVEGDAERWRALISSDRFTVMGWSGFEYDGESTVKPTRETGLHFTLNVWDKHPAGDDKQGKHGRAMLIGYVEHLRTLASLTAPASVGGGE